MKCKHNWVYQCNLLTELPNIRTTDKYYCRNCLKIKIIRS